MLGSTAGGATMVRDQQVAHVRENYRLALLGCPSLRRGDVTIPLTPSWQRLLGLIALTGTSSRPRLCGTLWPDSTERRAQGDLRTCLWRLNRACPGLLSTSGPRVGLQQSVICDVHHIERIARTVLRGEAGCVAPDVLRAALLDSRQLMPGSTDMWVLVERERLRQLRLHALEAWSSHLLDSDTPALALEAAHAAVECEPLRESAHRAVLQALLAAGGKDEARAHFTAIVTRLRQDLGVGPSPLLQAFARDTLDSADAPRS